MRRRDFLRRLSAVAASTVSLPCIIPSAACAIPGRPGPSDRLRIGIIGVGGRMQHLIAKDGPPDLDPVALADCDLAQMDRFARMLSEKHPQKFPGTGRWPRYQDYRKMT